jgi:ABC-type lipoprotein export system ATPase subunit
MDAERFPVKQPQEQRGLNLPPPMEPQPEQAGPLSAAVTVIAEKVSKSFQTGGQVIQAVHEVSFTFTEGQFVAVLGPSGSGKSTLLYLLGGLDRPSAGELTIDGVDVRRLSATQEHRFRRQKLGFVFQSFHLIPGLTALENVMLPMELKGGTASAAMHERARALLSLVGIDENRHQHRPGKLSGGQQQRVAIARALANDPKVILADEPTGNLDSQTGRLIVELLKQLADQGRTVIVVTHDPSIAEVADVRLEMQDGRIVTMENAVPPANSRPFPQKR